MESNNDENNLSLGKRIWLKYFKWIIGGIILAIAALFYWVYTRGKKDANAKVPETVPYPPDVTPPTADQIGEFNTWSKTDCPNLAKRISEFVNGWNINNSVLNFIIKDELSVLTDKKLVFLDNYYNRNYYKVNKGSLVKDLNSVWYVWGNLAKEDRDNIVKRLTKLGAK